MINSQAVEGNREPPATPDGPPPDPAGRWDEDGVIARRYHLERRLGSGSTGDVWLARDRLLRKSVALKVLQPELAKSRDTVRRFLREVALAHAVTHPHVVRIYDTGEEGGLPFFTMEYVKGQTLEERIEARDAAAGPLEFKEARRIALHVLDGLEAAHQVGVIHRDLKPGNVMLTHRGAIVMDFGVAGIEEAPAGPPTAASVQALVRTEAGTIFGSPAYMAPELWEGAGASVQSDLFAFGVMLYQMLTGRLPFQAKTPAGYLQQLTSSRPPSIRALRRDTPWPLLRVVGRCMNPDPTERPASAAAAVHLLDPLRGGRWRRVALGTLGLATAGAVVVGVQAPGEMRAQGLPDATAELDLNASVRMFDAGDDEAALRMLDRLATRAPRSAAVTFWRAVLHHEFGNAPGRRVACVRAGARQGSAAWRALAEAACAESFSIADGGARSLSDLEEPFSTLLPLFVQDRLLPAVQAELDADGPAHTEARALLTILEAPGEPDEDSTLHHRRQRARVDLELALGRVEEAEQHLTDLVDASPHVPSFAVRAAWLAARRGHDDRARALARRVRTVDPAPWLGLEMTAGRMRDAWAQIEAVDEGPRFEGLRTQWCGMAWRYAVAQPPPQCRDLPPGLVRDLWSTAESTAADPLERQVVQLQRALDGGECSEAPPPSIVLAQAPMGFELRRAEQGLENALCRAAAGRPETRAQAREQSSRLLAAAPHDPWVLELAARVDELSDEPAQAAARRTEAAARWRDADSDLPAVARARRAADGPRGLRAAEQ